MENVRLGCLVCHLKSVHVFFLPCCMLFYQAISKIFKMYKWIPSDVCKVKLSRAMKYRISNSFDFLSSYPCHDFLKKYLTFFSYLWIIYSLFYHAINDGINEQSSSISLTLILKNNLQNKNENYIWYHTF